MSQTPEFVAQLALLKQARVEADTARKSAYAASQEQQKLARQQSLAGRTADAEEAGRLEAVMTGARQQTGRAWGEFARRHDAQLAVLANLAAMLDPRDQAGQMDDAYPILLMPLRIETRFAPGANELWVRVYPDAWAVDGFEAKLSEKEVANGRVFWTDYWAAVGDRGRQLAAWRNLVANHGTGRARWIATSYRPTNETEAPAAPAVGGVLLVVEGMKPPQVEADAITAYWQALWRNPGDAAAATDALAQLRTELGDAPADAAAATTPRRFAEALPGVDRELVTLTLAWIEWPNLTDADVKAASWSEAARTDVLPERLVATLISGAMSRNEIGNVIPSTVTLGFDPSAPNAEEIQQVDGELKLPDALAWIFDFDKAVEMGLGFRIALSDVERSGGFDRILVCGVALRNDEVESGTALQTLIEHHHFSASDMGLLPQGAPTNNSEKPSGYSARDDVEDAFNRMFGGAAPDLTQTSELDKLDGQWLAEWLGIDPTKLVGLPYVEGRDQAEARAINRLLWPATIGYSLDTLMDDILGKDTVEHTRRYFEDYVLARDCVPQVRIGNQPYGILPAGAWSKLRWHLPRRDDNDETGPIISRFLSEKFGKGQYLSRLYGIMQQAGQQWDALVPGTANVGRAGDLHQTLLDILGLAPNSLEFYRRNADSHEHYFNLLRAQGLGGLFEILRVHLTTQAGKQLLQSMGSNGDETPEVLKFIFHDGQESLRSILVDDVALSEGTSLRAYTDDGKNYLQWLVTAGESSLEALRQQKGFRGDEVPTALLYHLARHALQLSYWDVGMRMRLAQPAAPMIARKEPAFLHIAQAQESSGSRYLELYQPAPAITGDAGLFLQDHIANVWSFASEAAEFRRVLGGLRALVDTPTARLERLLIEHLDLCTYRLDAWQQGMFQLQLEFMRHRLTAQAGPANIAGAANAPVSPGKGLYLGAYGWLEEVRPRARTLSPAQVPADLQDAFDAVDRPMAEDPDNLGYIHAPSLDQAQTAAVLRSTYVNNADPEHAKTTGVNLSSWRVRQAMSVLEGMRNDQSLGELLGYRLERELHENFAEAETDVFIFALRRHFPLIANRNTRTYQDLAPGESIATIEARNVVDGEKLLAHVTDSRNASYPFGLTDMPAADAAQQTKIDAAVERLRNVADAVADLALAESVHQALQGKPDSAAAHLDAQGSGLFPPVSEFVATPREGIAITSRTVLFFDPAPPAILAWAPVPQTARGAAEPVLNHWLGTLFPAPASISVRVHNDSTGSDTDFALTDLGRQPIDWLYELKLDDRQSQALLDQAIEEHYRRTQAPVGPRDTVTVRYAEAPAGKLSVFEFAPLVDTARQLVSRGRELKSSDIALSNDSRAEREGDAPHLPRVRADDALTMLDQLAGDAQTFVAPLDTHLADIVANEGAIRAGLAARLANYSALVRRARAFGLLELDAAIGMRWKRQWFTALDSRLAAVITDWERRLDDFHGHIARASAIPPGAPFNDVFGPLQRAERQISTAVTTPLPANPATMRADLALRAQAFSAKLAELKAVKALGTDNPDAFLTQLVAALPLTSFVPEDFDVAEANATFVRPTVEMSAGIAALLTAISKRKAAAVASLAGHATAEPAAATKLVQAALKALFGGDFIALPSFIFAAQQQAELALCEADKPTLIRHQRDDLGDPAPLDTWLHGVARVRNQMAAFEYLTMARDALTGADTSLDAWQLPYVAGAHWVGAAYPPDTVIDGDRLLLQSHHTVPFAPAAAQVGLLLDEWTEVIPTTDITTGVAFHFDRPNSEPPQTFLLMLPSDFRGGWRWQDIVDGLNETLDAAKRRAVEPEHIDATPYALFVPATLASTMHHPLSIALNYAVVNGYARALAQEII